MDAPAERPVPDFRGGRLFEALAETRDVGGLELLWRADQPELSQHLAEYLASACDPRLSDLLLSELSAPVLPATLRPNILAAIDKHGPPLSEEGVSLLADALTDGEASVLAPGGADQELLERWLFAQPGAHRDDYALLVIEDEIDIAPAAGTLTAALARCVGNDDLRARAAEAYRARLVELGDQAAWVRATEFIETCCLPTNRQPEIIDLVNDLVGLAPDLVKTTPIGPTLTLLIRELGQGAIERLLSTDEPVPASPGATALLTIAESFGRQEQRLTVFMLAYARHPALWPALDPLAQGWDEARWRQVLRRILKTPDEDLPARLSPLLANAPAGFSSLLVQIAVAHERSEADPELAVVVSAKTLDALKSARSSGSSQSPVLWWPTRRDEEGLVFVRELIAGFGSGPDRIDLLTTGLVERAATPGIIVLLLPEGMSSHLIERLRADAVSAESYRAVLDALLENRPSELREAAARMQPQSYDLQLAAVLAPTEPDTAFGGADAAYDTLESVSRDRLLDLLEACSTTAQLPVVERFARASDREERSRRAQSFKIIGRLLPPGQQVPDYLTDGMRVSHPAVSAAAFEAIGIIKPRQPEFLRELREMAATDGKIARSAAGTLDAMTDGFADELRGQITTAERCHLLTLLGAAARPKAIDLLLEHLGDAEWDDIGVHRAAAAAVVEVVPFVVKVATPQLERLGELLDGETQENDPIVREALSRASAIASLGPDDALNLLYEMAHVRPVANPDELFGVEKGTLVRQLGLYKRELDRGAVGRATAIAHLDNVAERVVRAAYTRLGSSEDIRRRIAANPRDPEYGHILNSLGGKLEKAKNGFGRLHEIRSEETEVPHPGSPMTEQAWTAATEGFSKAANICLAAVDAAIAADR
jgi:hypothetical protein